MTKAITYGYCKHGYQVFLIEDGEIKDQYSAGNSRFDSQAYVDPRSPSAVSLEQLAEFARQTAEEWAEEHGNCPVEHDADMRG